MRNKLYPCRSNVLRYWIDLPREDRLMLRHTHTAIAANTTYGTEINNHIYINWSYITIYRNPGIHNTPTLLGEIKNAKHSNFIKAWILYLNYPVIYISTEYRIISISCSINVCSFWHIMMSRDIRIYFL